MPGNPDSLRAAEAEASRKSPVDEASRCVQECPLGKKAKTKKKLTLRLVGRDGPYAKVRYELIVDGQTVSAAGALTDDAGMVGEEIDEDSKKGELRVWFDEFAHPEIYHLEVKSFQPPDSDQGFLDRVRAMGIHPGDDGKLRDVHIRELQRLLGLHETGTLDAALRSEVTRRHGS